MEKEKNYRIYIVLSQTYSMLARTIKSITHENYSHVSIAFDENCEEMYSFGRKWKHFPFYGIFKREKLDEGLFLNKNAHMAIYEIHVTKEQCENAKKRIKEIEKSNNGYNIAGLLLAYFKIKLHRNKYYCSEFVYEVLSSDGVEIIERDDKIFQPEELINRVINSVQNNLIYKGEIKDF